MRAKAEELASTYVRLTKKLKAILDDPKSRSGDIKSAAAALREAKALIEKQDAEARRWVDQNIEAAYKTGVETADETLTSQDPTRIAQDMALPNVEAAQRAGDALYADLAGRTEGISERLTLAIRDQGARAIRDAVARGANPSTTARDLLDALEAKGMTPQREFDRIKREMRKQGLSVRDQNEALRKLVDTGQITGFVDKGGKLWEPAKYALMVARTKQAQLYELGNLDRQLESGITMGRITGSQGATACPLCWPWAGLIVAYDQDTAEEFKLLTLQETLGGGPLYHPNCGHSVDGIVTALVTPEQIKAAQEQTRSVRKYVGLTAKQLRDALS